MNFHNPNVSRVEKNLVKVAGFVTHWLRMNTIKRGDLMNLNIVVKNVYKTEQTKDRSSAVKSLLVKQIEKKKYQLHK